MIYGEGNYMYANVTLHVDMSSSYHRKIIVDSIIN